MKSNQFVSFNKKLMTVIKNSDELFIMSSLLSRLEYSKLEYSRTSLQYWYTYLYGDERGYVAPENITFDEFVSIVQKYITNGVVIAYPTNREDTYDFTVNYEQLNEFLGFDYRNEQVVIPVTRLAI